MPTSLIVGYQRKVPLDCQFGELMLGIQVPPGRDGLKLAAGDEVHVGRAVVVVEITRP